MRKVIRWVFRKLAGIEPAENYEHLTFRKGKYFVYDQIGECVESYGKGIYIRDFCSIRLGKGARLSIGDNFFMNSFCSINCMYDVQIGRDVMFGEGVKIYDHNHAYSFNESGKLEISREQLSIKKVIIGNNVWIGSNVVILAGVVIGDNVIVGAGCTVSQSIISNSIYFQGRESQLKTNGSNK